MEVLVDFLFFLVTEILILVSLWNRLMFLYEIILKQEKC